MEAMDCEHPAAGGIDPEEIHTVPHTYLLGKPVVSDYMLGVIRGLGLDRMAGRRWRRYRDPAYDSSTDLEDYISDNPFYVHPYVNRMGAERALLEVHDVALLGGGASPEKIAFRRSGLLIHLARGEDGGWRPAAVTPESALASAPKPPAFSAGEFMDAIQGLGEAELRRLVEYVREHSGKPDADALADVFAGRDDALGLQLLGVIGAMRGGAK